MSDEIKPALTPEEWASVMADNRDDFGDETGPLKGVAIAYTNGILRDGMLCNPYAPDALIALLNHALPDADSRKFTQDDVDALLTIAFRIEDADSVMLGGKTWAEVELRALAARIAALLPPPRVVGRE
jgi:hypothetical protein